jgi:hypothetical protein
MDKIGGGKASGRQGRDTTKEQEAVGELHAQVVPEFCRGTKLEGEFERRQDPAAVAGLPAFWRVLVTCCVWGE